MSEEITMDVEVVSDVTKTDTEVVIVTTIRGAKGESLEGTPMDLLLTVAGMHLLNDESVNVEGVEPLGERTVE
jgi:hypothetical protein